MLVDNTQIGIASLLAAFAAGNMALMVTVIERDDRVDSIVMPEFNLGDIPRRAGRVQPFRWIRKATLRAWAMALGLAFLGLLSLYLLCVLICAWKGGSSGYSGTMAVDIVRSEASISGDGTHDPIIDLGKRLGQAVVEYSGSSQTGAVELKSEDGRLVFADTVDFVVIAALMAGVGATALTIYHSSRPYISEPKGMPHSRLRSDVTPPKAERIVPDSNPEA